MTTRHDATRFLALGAWALLTCAACTPVDDDDEDDVGGEGEGEGDIECAPAPEVDVGDEDAPLSMEPPFCTDVLLAEDGDQDCVSVSAPSGHLLRIRYDESDVDVDVYRGQYLSTEFTALGHTVQTNGDDVRVCFEPEDGAAPVTRWLAIDAPVEDVEATDDGGGSYTWSFDAPGDEDCAAIALGAQHHVIVTSDDCDDEADLEPTVSGADGFDFGFFASASGLSCGLALMSGRGDVELCIRDYGATRALGQLTFDVDLLADDHPSGAWGASAVTLPFSGAADIEIDGDRDCFEFTVVSTADIAITVSGHDDAADLELDAYWDDGDFYASGEASGVAQAVDGDATVCVRSFDGNVTLTVDIAAQ